MMDSPPQDHANIRVLNTNELSVSILRCAFYTICRDLKYATRLLVDGGCEERGWDANKAIYSLSNLLNTQRASSTGKTFNLRPAWLVFQVQFDSTCSSGV